MTMNFRDRLQQTNNILLHYFPLHSALADWGKDLESHLSEWILTHPDRYQEALVKSFEAGCHIACTQTQAASRWRAEVFGMQHKVREHNYESARLAKEVTPEGCYVGGLVSSTNPEFLQPVGRITPEEAYEGYREQISALLEGGVDLLIIAGNQLDTNLIAIQVAKDLSDVPIIAQNIFFHGKKGFRTMMGFDPATGSKRLEEAGADVVGGSCGLMKRAEDRDDPKGYYEWATELVREMRKGCNAVLSIQPNAGLAQLINEKTVYPATPDEIGKEAPRWIEAGARVIGGCCGTSLEHYRKLSEMARER